MNGPEEIEASNEQEEAISGEEALREETEAPRDFSKRTVDSVGDLNGTARIERRKAGDHPKDEVKRSPFRFRSKGK